MLITVYIYYFYKISPANKFHLFVSLSFFLIINILNIQKYINNKYSEYSEIY